MSSARLESASVLISGAVRRWLCSSFRSRGVRAPIGLSIFENGWQFFRLRWFSPWLTCSFLSGSWKNASLLFECSYTQRTTFDSVSNTPSISTI